MDLWQDFLINDNKIINKWTHYFPIYQKHLTPFKNKTINVLEIGVSKGGSLQMWRRFFGPLATIVGIDINKNCSKHEEDGISIRIGSQDDESFLNELINEFGEFVVVIDDGSHQMMHVKKTFEFLYPKISKNGVYIVEDMHTAYWEEYGGGIDNPSSFINVCKGFVDDLNCDHV